MNGWQKVRNIDPQSLTETRIQLHYAIQFMAAVGNFLTEPLPDYSHASLTWNSELMANALRVGDALTERLKKQKVFKLINRHLHKSKSMAGKMPASQGLLEMSNVHQFFSVK